MLYRTGLFCLLCASMFSAKSVYPQPSNISEQKTIDVYQKRLDNAECSSSDASLNMVNILTELNAEFEKYETSDPKEGYHIVFEEDPKLRARLIPMGASRKTVKLSGMPKKDDFYREHLCPFCTNLPKILMAYNDCLALISRSNQILMVPDEHSNHWFDISLEEQLKLLKCALEVRKQYSDMIKAPMELHCGSAAFQTVFHTHLRTGVFLK